MDSFLFTRQLKVIARVLFRTNLGLVPVSIALMALPTFVGYLMPKPFS